jgi:putative oxidoreductase
MRIGRLLARAAIGGLFVGHGTQKLFGWFGGPGPEGTAAMMEKLEMHPPRQNALLVGVTETGAGALLAAGAATPLAAAALIGTMITAIRKVHWRNGFWASGGGYEFNLTLIAALLLVVDGGPGELSVDEALGWPETGWKSTLGALAVGAAASTAAIELGRRRAPAAVPSPPYEPPLTTTEQRLGQTETARGR